MILFSIAFKESEDDDGIRENERERENVTFEIDC